MVGGAVLVCVGAGVDWFCCLGGLTMLMWVGVCLSVGGGRALVVCLFVLVVLLLGVCWWLVSVGDR